MILKSQQNGIELVTRPGFAQPWTRPWLRPSLGSRRHGHPGAVGQSHGRGNRPGQPLPLHHRLHTHEAVNSVQHLGRVRGGRPASPDRLGLGLWRHPGPWGLRFSGDPFCLAVSPLQRPVVEPEAGLLQGWVPDDVRHRPRALQEDNFEILRGLHRNLLTDGPGPRPHRPQLRVAVATFQRHPHLLVMELLSKSRCQFIPKIV